MSAESIACSGYVIGLTSPLDDGIVVWEVEPREESEIVR
jgi:hypothetical protein